MASKFMFHYIGRYGYSGGNTAGIHVKRLTKSTPQLDPNKCKKIWAKLENLLRNGKEGKALLLMQCCMYKGLITDAQCCKAIDLFSI